MIDLRSEFILEIIQDAFDAAVDLGFAVGQGVSVYNLDMAEKNYQICAERLYTALQITPNEAATLAAGIRASGASGQSLDGSSEQTDRDAEPRTSR
jgi:hypothetical protein